ncbi:helix-turn-helix transcriptional regulator [Undibacterium sp. TJN25]|uniref:helix-turn-helix transcriptional regulator n=1 Tax=Undibacterium sp. TJN25 TaxID=3413056 RepID=UPI003BF0E3FB
MRYWNLNQARSGSLDISRATGIMAAIAHEDSNAMAAEIVRTLDALAPVSQCTIFAYENSNRPRTVSVADHRGGKFLKDIADTYSRFFYSFDGNQTIVSSADTQRRDPAVFLHHQSTADIGHAAYREACYGRPHVSDRLSLLSQPAKNVWLAINLYRDLDQGQFTPDEIQKIEVLTPLFAHAARNHYATCGQGQLSIAEQMLARVREACDDLSKRELDVVRGVLEGRTAQEIAELMGIRVSSVQTYQKRAYRRLGISSQRQLFALCLSR